MDLKLIELAVHELTVVVAAGLSDALSIMELLGFYAKGAVPDADPEPYASLVLYVELAKCGLLDLSEFVVR